MTQRDPASSHDCPARQRGSVAATHTAPPPTPVAQRSTPLQKTPSAQSRSRAQAGAPESTSGSPPASPHAAAPASPTSNKTCLSIPKAYTSLGTPEGRTRRSDSRKLGSSTGGGAPSACGAEECALRGEETGVLGNRCDLVALPAARGCGPVCLRPPGPHAGAPRSPGAPPSVDEIGLPVHLLDLRVELADLLREVVRLLL